VFSRSIGLIAQAPAANDGEGFGKKSARLNAFVMPDIARTAFATLPSTR
jgi:hypothetical protein